MWVRSDYGPQSPVQSYANQPPIVAISHTYDRSSNKLTATEARPGARLPFRDRVFTYDGLNRLVDEARTPVPTSGYTEQHLAKAWDLDMLGNWRTLLTDVEKDGDASDAAGGGSHQRRLHNGANEIESPSPTAQYDAIVTDATGSAIGGYRRFGYDDAGNMTEQRSGGALPVPPTRMPGIVMTYDAWNRLIATNHEPSTGPQVAVSEYCYNALGWRTVKRFDTSMGGYDGIDQERVMLYDAAWRMVEERVDTDLDDDADYVSQQFWGLRYVDDAVAKRINRDLADPDGWVNNPGVSVWYQLADSQFSVVAVLDHKGGLYERIEYDAYGNARHRPSGDANGDGLFSFADLSLFTGSGSIGSGGYHADWDLNFDGVVDTLDFGILTAQGTRTAALRSGWISDPRATSTGPDNSIGYCGYVFNPERDDYTVRFRVYAPELGRWRTRDPIGYRGGGNLYGYVGSQPAKWLDPMGLQPQLPFNPDAGGTTDPRDDPNKGCGIKYGRNPGLTGHAWITIDDPAAGRPQHFGYWPGPASDPSKARVGKDYPGFIYDPTYEGPWDPDDPNSHVMPFDDPRGANPDPGAAIRNTRPKIPYIEDGKIKYHPGRLPGGSPTGQSDCAKVRACVIAEMRKLARDDWNLTKNNCRDAAVAALERCGLSVEPADSGPSYQPSHSQPGRACTNL